MKTSEKKYLTSSQDLYLINKRKLGFLPRIFAYFAFGLISFVIIFYYLDTRSSSQGYSPYTMASRQEVYDKNITFQNPSLFNQVEQDNLEDNNNNQNEDKPVTEITVSNENSSCNLKYIGEKPPQIETPLESEIEGWWKAESCQDPNLLYLQIVRTNEIELNPLKNFIVKENIQTLSQNDVYAIIYSLRNSPGIFDFREYDVELTSPIFKNLKFSPSTAHDTLRLEDKTFYLDGKCQGKSNNSCKLWVMDNLSGDFQLLKTNIAMTGTGQENELFEGQQIIFSDNQEEESVKFSILNEDGSFKEVKVDMEKYEIIE
jgi:hypothetical protein